MVDKPDNTENWNLATWEGARRETMRRWAELPLENIIAALEEMQTLDNALHRASRSAGVHLASDSCFAGMSGA